MKGGKITCDKEKLSPNGVENSTWNTVKLPIIKGDKLVVNRYYTGRFSTFFRVEKSQISGFTLYRLRFILYELIFMWNFTLLDPSSNTSIMIINDIPHERFKK